MKFVILISSVVMLQVGCSVYRVDGAGEGIPFYKKVGLIKQQTVYSRTWIQIKLDFARVAGDGTKSQEQSFQILVDPSRFDLSNAYGAFIKAQDALPGAPNYTIAVQAFESELRSLCGCLLSLNDVFVQSDPLHSSPANLAQGLISNRSEQVSIVDYSNTHHINVRAPVFGTASATVKLASDGTLTEATGAVDSTKLAELVPIKELLVDKWGLEKIALGAAGPPKPTVTMTIQRDGFNYTIEKYFPDFALNRSPLSFSTPGVGITRSKLGSPKKPKEDKNAFSFSGSVKLPKK